MIHFEVKLDAKGTLTMDEDSLSTSKCTLNVSASHQITDETLHFVKIAILEKVLSNELGISVKDILDEHMEIQQLTKQNPK
jgi:hypothetical protein